MSERDQLEETIAALESQRAALGDAVVDASVAALRKQLATLEQAEPLAPELHAERKLVTVMFADISGFTAMSESMDPEAVRDLMNACFEQLVPVVERCGGTVDKFIGDEIMALYGAPVAHENDPERALRAALEMTGQLAAFNLQHSTDLGIHFGINTGLVIAGGIGTGECQEYSVMGDAVNLAKRLEEVSERGEILAGPDTYRLTAPLFAFEALDPVRVKGKAEPVTVYRLVGPKAEPGRTRGLETRGISSPLVGRDDEFAALCGCIERLRNGQGGILSIIGEAGVGKSRLMAELRSQVLGPSRAASSTPTPDPQCLIPNLIWLEGRTLSFGQTISYWPFQEILWRYAGISEEDSEADAWHKLESRVNALFAEQTPEILPYLATLLTLEVRDEYVERVKYLDGEAMGRQVFLASRRFFERLAQAQPTVLVFEDLHWVDASSALLLEHLLPLVRSVPLSIVGVSRPEPDSPVAHLPELAAADYADRYTEIRLSPLSRTDSAQLVRNLLAIEDLPSRVREMIVRKAEGNPFFLEEIIRTLIDAGAVIHEPTAGRWQATARIETITIPDTVQGVIMARVDRLDEEVKQVLRTASVVGRSFLYRVLCAVCVTPLDLPVPSAPGAESSVQSLSRAIAEVDQQLDEHLSELQAIELIREKQRVPELEYIFKHALAQEATYESILLQRRRELHACVGQAIEVLFAGRLEEFYGLLAYHYARAEAWEKAQEYLLKAGDQAGRVAADAEALAHYEQALVAYGCAFGDRWDPVQRAALERKIGEALFRRGEHQQALEYLERALAYLGKPLPTSRWGVLLAILGQVAWQIGHRLFPGLFLRQAGGSVSPAMEEETRSWVLIGWIAGSTDPERLLLVALRGLNASERGGSAYGVVAGCTGLGLILDSVPIFWLAKSYHHRAVALAEQIQHPGALGLAYMGLGMHEKALGQWDLSNEHIRRAAEVYRESGDLHGWGNVVTMLAAALNYQGDLEQSLAYCRDVTRVGREGADPQVQCWGLAVQGCALRRMGRLDEALTVLKEAVALAKAIPDHMFHITAGGDLGCSYLSQGRVEQALSTLEACQPVYAEHGARWGAENPFCNGLAEAYLSVVEQSGRTERAAGLKKARRACQDALRRGRMSRAGLPEAMRLRGTYAWLRGRRAIAQKWWQRSLSLAEKQGQRYDLGLAHLEMGQRLGERAHLERAEVILGDVGAQLDLARARDLLGRESEQL
jgi:class 3 adenylate cyclase/tetratricopeptide (TPR) repeat protein